MLVVQLFGLFKCSLRMLLGHGSYHEHASYPLKHMVVVLIKHQSRAVAMTLTEQLIETFCNLTPVALMWHSQRPQQARLDLSISLLREALTCMFAVPTYTGTTNTKSRRWLYRADPFQHQQGRIFGKVIAACSAEAWSRLPSAQQPQCHAQPQTCMLIAVTLSSDQAHTHDSRCGHSRPG